VQPAQSFGLVQTQSGPRLALLPLKVGLQMEQSVSHQTQGAIRRKGPSDAREAKGRAPDQVEATLVVMYRASSLIGARARVSSISNKRASEVAVTLTRPEFPVKLQSTHAKVPPGMYAAPP